MKRFILTKIVMVMGIFLFALPALAATTASLAPANLNIVPGQKFSVVVSVNPQGTANFAEKLEVKFPADMLEVSSFTLGSNWMAMTQTGYDATDNTSGVLIKTAGYPNGITTSTNFGTITFLSKKAGNGKISIGNNSLAFSASSKSVITGNEASFISVTPVVAIVKPVIKDKVAISPTSNTAEAEQVNNIEEASTTQVENQPQLAAAADAVPTTTGGISWTWIIAIIALIVVVYIIFISLKKKQNKI